MNGPTMDCSAVENGTALRIDVQSTPGADCGLATRTAYDLRNGEISVAVVSAPTVSGAMTGFLLRHPGLTVQFGFLGPGLTFEVSPGGCVASGSDRSCDALRIRHDNNLLSFWARSTTGGWTWFAACPMEPSDLEEVQIAIGTHEYLPVTPGSSFGAVLDNYNLVP